ncbi:MAG: hypothetical protein RLN67_10715, partial [Algiphilus sp.]
MRILFYGLAWLPLPMLQLLGSGVGALLWWGRSARRRVALANIAACMPERSAREQARIARISLRHEFMTYVETA